MGEMTTAEVLTKARDIVANTWTKGCLRDSGGAYCSAGAIAEVTGDLTSYEWTDHVGTVHSEAMLKDERSAAFKNAVAAMGAQLPNWGHDSLWRIFNFNDDGVTVIEEVLATFDSAIATTNTEVLV